MVRGAERPPSPVRRIESADQRLDRGGFERFLFRHLRQYSGKACGQHGFSGAGRTDHENAVPAACRDFERAPGVNLALDFAEIRIEDFACSGNCGEFRNGFDCGEVSAYLGEGMSGMDGGRFHDGGLEGILEGQYERTPVPLRNQRHCQDTPDRTQFAGEGELSGEFVIQELVFGNLV